MTNRGTSADDRGKTNQRPPENADCATCGGACCRIDWDVAFDRDELVPKHLSTPGTRMVGDRLANERLMLKNADNSCIALVKGRCSIYELRPTLCREFELGSDCCLEAIAAMKQVGKSCCATLAC